MLELVNVIFAAIPMEYAVLISFACYVLTHVVNYIPISVSEKIPDTIMSVINIVGAKHGTLRAVKTDIKGNIIRPSGK